MKKKLLSILLIIALLMTMLIGLTACGDDEDDDEEVSKKSSKSSKYEEEEEDETKTISKKVAQKTVNAYYDAILEADVDGVMDVMDFDLIEDLAEIADEDYEPKELDEDYFEDTLEAFFAIFDKETMKDTLIIYSDIEVKELKDNDDIDEFVDDFNNNVTRRMKVFLETAIEEGYSVYQISFNGETQDVAIFTEDGKIAYAYSEISLTSMSDLTDTDDNKDDNKKEDKKEKEAKTEVSKTVSVNTAKATMEDFYDAIIEIDPEKLIDTLDFDVLDDLVNKTKANITEIDPDDENLHFFYLAIARIDNWKTKKNFATILSEVFDESTGADTSELSYGDLELTKIEDNATLQDVMDKLNGEGIEYLEEYLKVAIKEGYSVFGIADDGDYTDIAVFAPNGKIAFSYFQVSIVEIYEIYDALYGF